MYSGPQLRTVGPVRAIRRFTVRTVLPAELHDLDELSLNLRWSWHTPSRELFSTIDPQLWESVKRDPVALLGALGPDRLAALAADQEFVSRVRAAAADLHRYLQDPMWYQEQAAGGEELPQAIAYFSPEYGITSVLPQYSGGLGIL
ncbi:MAG: glycosyltransferase family 1 protein, partial [Oerskovia sp.]|nr:glycosyltransferase family 1 protein [Oerskovia sp.]